MHIFEPMALAALKNNQRQLDVDGCEVGVSRQALDMAIEWIEKKQAVLEEAVELAQEVLRRTSSLHFANLASELIGAIQHKGCPSADPTHLVVEVDHA